MSENTSTETRQLKGSEEMLRRLGLQLKPITEDQIRMVNSRDFDGDYPYVSLFFSKYRDSVDAVGLWAGDYLVGYAIAGVFEKNAKKTGEVGMTHIPPPVRDLGLGSLLSLLMRERLLLKNPERLYSEIGDNSGKVKRLLEELGYEQTGISSGAGMHPIWERNFTDDKDKELLNAAVEKAIFERVEKLKSKQAMLVGSAQKVDKDNPYKVDISQAVAERLTSTNIFSSKETVTIFGYVGAKVRIARSMKDDGGGYSIMLDILNADMDRVKLVVGQDGGFNFEQLYSWRKDKEPTIRVSTSFTRDKGKLENSMRDLSTLAEQLI